MQSDNSKPVKSTGSRYGGIEHRLRSIDKQRRLVLATTDDPETQRAMREIGSALYDVSGFRRASELRDGVDRGEHIETDGGTDRCTGDTERIDVPQPATFPEGGTIGGVCCSRCGEPASRSYEGVEPLDFCEGCFHDFGEWINRDIETDTDRSEADR